MKLLLILFGAFLLPAESVHSLLPEAGRFKMSDGLLLHWNANATDPNRDAVEAFDRSGARVSGVNIYQLLPSAKNRVHLTMWLCGAGSPLPSRPSRAKRMVGLSPGCCALDGTAAWLT